MLPPLRVTTMAERSLPEPSRPPLAWGKDATMRTNTRMLVLGTLLTMAVPSAVASAQASDPAIGTWVLNVAKSTYSPGPGPKSSTRTYVATEKGWTYSSKGIDADGKPSANTFTAKFDGKYTPLTGSAAVDSILVTRVDANGVKGTEKKGDKVVIHVTRVIAQDGKTMTVTTTGTDAAGKPSKNVEVFDKK
jgi:hypothetical protein